MSCVFINFLLTGKVLPKKRAFYNRDFKRSTSRSKNFSLFQTYKFLWKREKFLRIFLLNSQRIPSTPLFWQYYVTCSFFIQFVCLISSLIVHIHLSVQNMLYYFFVHKINFVRIQNIFLSFRQFYYVF